MPIEPVPTEMIHTISREEQTLRDHFSLFYQILTENKIVPDAAFSKKDGVESYFTGLTEVFYNVSIGEPKKNLDKSVEEQIHFFSKKKTPFVWYLTKNTHPELEQALTNHGFKNIGTFKGTIGPLDKSMPAPTPPKGYTLELIKDDATIDAFNEILCKEFSLQETTKAPLKKVLLDSAKDKKHTMYHYGAKKDGKLVSILSTLVDGDVVSFWNAASLPEIRKQGVFTALLRMALKDAISKGCNTGVSYLMTEGMALGICEKLGYETKWEFNLFLSP